MSDSRRSPSSLEVPPASGERAPCGSPSSATPSSSNYSKSEADAYETLNLIEAEGAPALLCKANVADAHR